MRVKQARKTVILRAQQTNNNELLPAGRIAGIFGIRGELKCDPTESGRTLFAVGARFHASLDGVETDVTIASIREHQKRFLIRFVGVENANDALRYVHSKLLVPREELSRGVASDEYLDVDLIGCAVESAQGVRLGIVRDIEHYPASDMLMLPNGMIPIIREFIRSIDLPGKRIVVEIPEGLLDASKPMSDETSSIES